MAATASDISASRDVLQRQVDEERSQRSGELEARGTRQKAVSRTRRGHSTSTVPKAVTKRHAELLERETKKAADLDGRLGGKSETRSTGVERYLRRVLLVVHFACGRVGCTLGVTISVVAVGACAQCAWNVTLSSHLLSLPAVSHHAANQDFILVPEHPFHAKECG